MGTDILAASCTGTARIRGEKGKKWGAGWKKVQLSPYSCPQHVAHTA